MRNRNKRMALDIDVFLAGEQIRNDMRSDPDVIKDRRYHLRHYTSCFVGCECIDWLVKKGEATNKDVALAAMQLLVDHNIVHHVCDDHPFRNEYLFYRFRRDDNTFIDSKESRVLARGLSLYRRLHGDSLGVVYEHTESGNTYDNSFYADEMISWLRENWNKKKSRDDLEEECKELLEFDVIKHVTDDHHFKDSHYLYQFKPDLHRKRSLVGLLFTKSSRSSLRPHCDSNSSTSSSTPSLRRISVGSTCSSSSEASLSFMFPTTDSDYTADDDSLTVTEGATPKPVIIRKVTPNELEDPESPFVKKNVSILADSVGFGFVVRGTSPTYVQTIDPTGPAASAGLKIRQYIYSVEGQVVVRKTHREVANIIRGCYGRLNLVVMMHFRDASLDPTIE